MELILFKKKQLIGKFIGFNVKINNEFIGKVYENNPLIVDVKRNELKIVVSQLWIKSKLYITDLRDNEKIEISYSLSDNIFLGYGFLIFLLIILFLFYKMVLISYIILALNFWLLIQLTKNGSIILKRNR